jgi:hypothetical protein
MWQPIETAPKNGSTMLLFYGDPIRGPYDQRITVGWWYDIQNAWVDELFTLGGKPTHWMAFPDPPRGLR